jgi:hypothetical protein
VSVIATGGIGDARGIVAALALGAAAVQLVTAYMFSSEAGVPVAHRDFLLDDLSTVGLPSCGSLQAPPNLGLRSVVRKLNEDDRTQIT